MINLKLRDNVLELLQDATVHYDKCNIPCSVLFRADDYYVKQNKKAYDSLNKALHQYYREYFKEHNLDLRIAINVWSSMRDEDNRTVDEMLEAVDNSALKTELDEFPTYRQHQHRKQRLLAENYKTRTIDYIDCLTKTDDEYSYIVPSRYEYFDAEQILRIEDKIGQAYRYISTGQSAKKDEMCVRIHTMQYMKHFRSYELHTRLEELKELNKIKDAKVCDSDEYKTNNDVIQRMIDAK